ncbi:hypothetical protein FALCPG4_008569 [Fusarium falciforme]
MIPGALQSVFKATSSEKTYDSSKESIATNLTNSKVQVLTINPILNLAANRGSHSTTNNGAKRSFDDKAADYIEGRDEVPYARC